MNAKRRDVRLQYADGLRARALHDVSRLREALALIADIAEAPGGAQALPAIARLARSALVVCAPPDPHDGTDTDHT
ncbi:conserved hypothetical protein [Burkholderia diffusa]|uniref:hypothetical protein n=1 Tax=Burkholderia diffusa TaxID=488732 RepID=UPI001CB1FECC|nr:hypothetical protein [Burkholderia diffusa]CAG9241118.1 conserved hypothetical protein [Burkholderia diffusa]